MRVISRALIGILAVMMGTMMFGMVWKAFGLAFPPRMPGTNEKSDLVAMMVGAVILVIGFLPVAAGMGSKVVSRWAALFALVYIPWGINTTIEARIFSNMFQTGYGFLMIYPALASLLLAAVLATLPKTSGLVKWPSFGLAGWGWRLLVAWLAFPVIYFFFGMMVGPFVVKYYQGGPWVIPPMGVILRTQLLRSVLFLLASLPVVLLWAKSRKSLIVCLGLAHAAVVGLSPLASAYFMPVTMRVLHSIEITADSLTYATVLGMLFACMKKPAASSESESKQASVAVTS